MFCIYFLSEFIELVLGIKSWESSKHWLCRNRGWHSRKTRRRQFCRFCCDVFRVWINIFKDLRFSRLGWNWIIFCVQMSLSLALGWNTFGMYWCLLNATVKKEMQQLKNLPLLLQKLSAILKSEIKSGGKVVLSCTHWSSLQLRSVWYSFFHNIMKWKILRQTDRGREKRGKEGGRVLSSRRRKY